MVNVNSSDLIYNQKFLAFCSLATEGYGGNNSAPSRSIGFSEFCEKLEKNEVVKPENKKSSPDLNKSLDYWKSRFNPGGNLSALDSQVLDIIKKAYNFNKDNMLLRNEAVNAYKNSN
ncbi:hypothetical protein ACSHUI_03540 [Bacillus subtilis]|uniref:hypothetical protein n=1 Tax=Bacillus subtilis TaxID=1423 RepID=UPI0007E5049F|nr:hypothetical protein [Bacillus subtilis]MDF4196535.1 hypothetical protein [Bacillus subtilis]MDF4217511.1 hypothetical protein [Bacillus subtilis]NRF02858.1 hypothetical protein [Bacillus subtilis]NRG37258.1 hypothetical protein [Bacillus subtilis]OAY90035.1 hypothetical protein AWM78_05385 [Bacillus subtilis subsp. subtilis]